jgi:hypothetical protein
MHVKDYVESSGDGTNRTLKDTSGELTLGPFTSDSLSYEDSDWYNESTNQPVTFHVNVSFDDGTSDHYTIKKNDTGLHTVEASGVEWTTPENLGFSTPGCLGSTDTSCPGLTSVNITNVGTEDDPTYTGVITTDTTTNNGTAMYGLQPGSKEWTKVDPGIDVVFHDAVVNPSDPERWVAVGEGGHTVASYDTGENWSRLPDTTSDIDVFRSIDHTHPDSPTVVGGTGIGARFAIDGYVREGFDATQDLVAPGEHNISQIERVKLSAPPTMHADPHEAPVDIQVWDENADGGSGAWTTIYQTGQDPEAVNLTGTTDQAKLRFKLATDSTGKLSPTVRGNLTLDIWDNTDPHAGPDSSIEFDLKEDSDDFDRPFEWLDYNEDHGTLRLQSTRNPWMYQLGNEDEGDWTTARNHTGSDAGARPADMALSENETTIWVVTEGIYEHGAGEEEPPVLHPDCDNAADDFADCLDNTLYAINASTGLPQDWWDPMHFQKPPQHLSVGDRGLSVVVGNETTESTVYWMEFTDPRQDQNTTFGDTTKRAKALVTVDAFSGFSGEDDPVVATEDTATGNGDLSAWPTPDMNDANGWSKMPAMTDEFDFRYQVPDDAIYGSRVVVTEVRWNLTDQYDAELVQSARLHDTFEVTPEGGQMPLVPTYTLEVVAWIEDWR